MKFLRKSLASLLTLLFINLVVSWIFFVSLAQTYLNPEFYTTSAVEDEIYPDLVEQISKTIFEKEPQLVSVFSEEEMIQMIRVVFPFTLFLEMIDDFFDQLNQSPLPDELVVSIETLKHNMKTFVEEDEELSQFVDPTTIDYMANSIVFPIHNIPESAQQSFAFTFQNTSLISYVLLGAMAVLFILIVLLVGQPLSHRFAWASSNLLFSAVPIVLLAYSFKNSVSNFYPFTNPLLQSAMAPFLDFMLKIGFAFSLAGVLCFVVYLFLKFSPSHPSKSNSNS